MKWLALAMLLSACVSTTDIVIVEIPGTVVVHIGVCQ